MEDVVLEQPGISLRLLMGYCSPGESNIFTSVCARVMTVEPFSVSSTIYDQCVKETCL